MSRRTYPHEPLRSENEGFIWRRDKIFWGRSLDLIIFCPTFLLKQVGSKVGQQGCAVQAGRGSSYTPQYASRTSLSLSLSLSLPPPPKQKAITLICVRHAASHSRMRWCQQENEKTLSLEARSLCVQLLWVSGTAGATGGNTLGRAHTIRKELNGQSIWKSVSNLWRHA